MSQCINFYSTVRMSSSHWCGGLCSRRRCILAAVKNPPKPDIKAAAKQLQQNQKQRKSGLPPMVRSQRFLSKFDISSGMHPVHWAQLRFDAWRKRKVFTQTIKAALGGSAVSSSKADSAASSSKAAKKKDESGPANRKRGREDEKEVMCC